MVAVLAGEQHWTMEKRSRCARDAGGDVGGAGDFWEVDVLETGDDDSSEVAVRLDLLVDRRRMTGSCIVLGAEREREGCRFKRNGGGN